MIPGVSLTLLPPEALAVLLFLPVQVYRPILGRLLAGVAGRQDKVPGEWQARWLLSEDFQRTLSRHWQTYRLTPDQTSELVDVLLERTLLEPTQKDLKPYSQETSECLIDEYTDIFPDPWHIRLNVLLHAIPRYASFLQTLERYSLNSQVFEDFLRSRMLPEPTEEGILLCREWHQAGWGSPHYMI